MSLTSVLPATLVLVHRRHCFENSSQPEIIYREIRVAWPCRWRSYPERSIDCGVWYPKWPAHAMRNAQEHHLVEISAISLDGWREQHILPIKSRTVVFRINGVVDHGSDRSVRVDGRSSPRKWLLLTSWAFPSSIADFRRHKKELYKFT